MRIRTIKTARTPIDILKWMSPKFRDFLQMLSPLVFSSRIVKKIYRLRPSIGIAYWYRCSSSPCDFLEIKTHFSKIGQDKSEGVPYPGFRPPPGIRRLGPLISLDLWNNHLMRRHAIHARGTPGKSKVLAHHTAPESPGSETMFEGSLILS
jgi:hypothetical protein